MTDEERKEFLEETARYAFNKAKLTTKLQDIGAIISKAGDIEDCEREKLVWLIAKIKGVLNRKDKMWDDL